jgi:hypothetical protein
MPTFTQPFWPLMLVLKMFRCIVLNFKFEFSSVSVGLRVNFDIRQLSSGQLDDPEMELRRVQCDVLTN